MSSYRGLYPGQTSYAPKGYRVWLAKRVRPLLRAHRLDGGDEDEQPMRAAAPGPVLATGRRGAGAAPRFADPTLF